MQFGRMVSDLAMFLETGRWIRSLTVSEGVGARPLCASHLSMYIKMSRRIYRKLSLVTASTLDKTAAVRRASRRICHSRDHNSRGCDGPMNERIPVRLSPRFPESQANRPPHSRSPSPSPRNLRGYTGCARHPSRPPCLQSWDEPINSN